MSGRAVPRVLSIPPGAPFLPTLAEALLAGRLVPVFRRGAIRWRLPMSPSTCRRAAPRARCGRCSSTARRAAAILPVIRPLGEFDEDEAVFGEDDAASLDLAPPIAALDRLLYPGAAGARVEERLPAHVARCSRRVVVPASRRRRSGSRATLPR